MANNTSNRGFASMDPERQKEIASQGGKAAHEKGTAHEFTPEEAAEAGRKGGKASHSNGRGNNRGDTEEGQENFGGGNRGQERNEDGEFE